MRITVKFRGKKYDTESRNEIHVSGEKRRGNPGGPV